MSPFILLNTFFHLEVFECCSASWAPLSSFGPCWPFEDIFRGYLNPLTPRRLFEVFESSNEHSESFNVLLLLSWPLKLFDHFAEPFRVF